MKTLIIFCIDFITALLIIVPVILGFIRGAKYHIFTLISLVVSMAAAYAVATVFTQPVYDRFIKEKVIAHCTEYADMYDPVKKAGDILESYGVYVSDEQIRNALVSAEKLPVSVGKLAEDNGIDAQQVDELEEEINAELNRLMPQQLRVMIPGGLDTLSAFDLSDAQVYDTVRACLSSPEEAAEYAEENYIAPVCLSAVKSALYFITMGIMSLIMRLAFYLFGFSLSDRASSGLDRFGGVMLGAVAACANILMLCAAVYITEKIGGGYIDIEKLGSIVLSPVYHFVAGLFGLN